MKFELLNEQRVYLGLELIDEHWQSVKLCDEQYLYFDGDIIRKSIVIRDNYYHESSLNERTIDNRRYLAPKTDNGKPVNLTSATLEKRTKNGTYFLYNERSILIGNYTTQKTFYYSGMAGVFCNDFIELSNWLNHWIQTTTAADLEDIKLFSSSRKKLQKYREGDFFRFRIDRGLYGFGRILLNYDRLRKENVIFWDILAGKPLVVKVYHLVSEDPNVHVGELKTLKAIPSQFIMDNIFYYGECEIIGYEELSDVELDFPIMYGRSISALDPNMIVFQQGLVYRTIPIENGKIIGDFRNNGIGYDLKVNRDILQECQSSNSNNPYWNQNLYSLKSDLRNPKNEVYRKQILKQFNL